MTLFEPFREWQQEIGDIAREVVGVISYTDFDSHQYETLYRLGVDVLNSDAGMVVEFLAQRQIT